MKIKTRNLNVQVDGILHSITIILIVAVISCLIIGANSPVQADADQTTQVSTGSYPGKTQYPWLMFQHDRNKTSFSPGPSPATDHLLWKVVTPKAARTSPSIVDGMVLIGDTNGWLYALDFDTGETIWSLKLGTTFGYSNMPVYNGFVYPIVLGPVPYVQGAPIEQKSYLVCVDVRNGDISWKFCFDNLIRGNIWWGAEPADGKIIIGSSWNVMYSVNARMGFYRQYGGELVWEQNLTNFSGTPGDYGIMDVPLIFDGKIYIGSRYPEGHFYCLNQTTGSILWAKNFEGSPRSATVAYDKLYVGVSYPLKSVYCLDPETGELVWNFTEAGLHGSMGLAAAYGKIYFGDFDGYFYSVNATTGDLVWKYLTGGQGGIVAAPAVAEGRVYVGTSDENFYCFDAENGTIIWKYDIGDIIESSPAIADGRVVFGSNRQTSEYGCVWCFGKGPTKIALSTTSSSLDLGRSTFVSGILTDQSPASLNTPLSGVPITIGYSYDGKYTEITKVVTDSTGSFVYKLTPSVEGFYTITASFNGTESYYSSNTETTIGVTASPSPAGPIEPEQPASFALTSTELAIIAVVVIALVGVVAFWIIRKRK